MKEDIAQQDRTARKALMSVLPMPPKTPREAYELSKGGPATDDEWATHGAAWARNWDECVELYDTVMQAEEVLAKAYEE